MGSHSDETAAGKAEEGRGDVKSVCCFNAGLHASYNRADRDKCPRKGKLKSKPHGSSDRRLKLAGVKLDSQVIASQDGAVNTSIPLVHTAHRTNRVEEF